nr:sulfite exporter TauE/SafE family protein [Desulfitibacter alkalitolerans]
MPDYYIPLIIATGIAAGFLNTVGGGGSLITMPMLIFFGMPSAMANGTNRVALVVQNVVAVAGFRHKGFFDLRFGLILGIPAMVGSIVGAGFAINLSDEIFNRILAVVMLLVLYVILFEPHKKYIKYEEEMSREKKWAAGIVFFFIGIYGGFIQAGVGFIIIAALSILTGLSLVKINSLKVFVVGLYIVTSLIVFVLSGNVDWLIGILLAAGNAVGAWAGSIFAVKGGDKWIRWVLAASVIAMALKLLGVFNLFT